MLLSRDVLHRQHLAGTSSLEISFATRVIREICEKRDEAIDALGYDAARQLEDRLADIVAMQRAGDLMTFFQGDITELSADVWSLRLSPSHAIVFMSAHIKPKRLTQAGATDWARVTRIRVEAIEGVNG